LSNPETPETTNSAIPTAAQLAETRLKQWHQQGEALLTMENLRSWINTAGLVLFAPRPQIAAPAPSLVEAVLGTPNPTPTIEQTAEARALLARLVAEGLAVPLNLMGPGAGTVHAAAPGDTPDFVASTAVFSYVFTLRGDKAWKQPPVTTGALKMSNLALAIYEALSRRGPLSAYDLTTEVGKEVTEAAALRALGELWMHLRVIPLAQPDGAATLWELASARFTKQIKAGANAGQPSALSALISLYLGQAAVASEEEIESFLSPLASRSRIRDVIHALLSARQLDTIAVEGRTMLHVTGALPAFLAVQAAVATEPEVAAEGGIEAGIEVEANAPQGAADAGAEDAPRITKFVPKPRKIGTGYLAKAKPSKFGAKPGPFERGSKPSSKPSFSKPSFKSGKPEFKPGFKPREGFAPPSARERRPFTKPGAPAFDKPWDEGKSGAAKPRRDFAPRDRAGDARPPRRDFGTGDARPPRREFGTGDARPPRREFAARGEGDARPARKTFSKPGTFGRKREGFAARATGEGRREFTPRPRTDRPRSREDSAAAPRKPYPPRGAGFFSGKPRPSDDRTERAAGGERNRQDRGPAGAKPVYRKFDAPRDRPARPFSPGRAERSFSSDRPSRPFSSDRPARAERSDKPRKPGDFAPRKFAGKPSGKPGGFARKPGGKPAGSFAGKKPKAGGSFSGKPDSTFAKFAGNKKPFGKRAPARKFKPQKGESA
jgi:23S rRNA pseudouridine2605 synthase